DYVFKSAAADAVPAEELGAFFAGIYLVLNVLSLGMQVLLVRPLIRTMGVQGALAVLPLILVGAGGFLALGGGLLAALVIKGADGSLRHSLHRTSSELLYLP